MRYTPKKFSFTYPVKHKIVRDLKIITETIGDLTINAVGYIDNTVEKSLPDERYSVDVEEVLWRAVDVRQLLEVVGGIEEIYAAAEKELAAIDAD